MSTLAELDLRGVALVRGLPHPRAADAAMIALSRATDHSAAWLAIGLLGTATARGRRCRWLGATGRIAAVELVTRATKRVQHRARPALKDLPPLARVTSPVSFPSSHTAAAVAAVGAFDGLLPRPLLQGAAAASAFSRLYLGLHFPSDVAAGAAIGHVVVRLTTK